ncbi:hypothetical protein HRI_002958900 [Hibiscus trionum]|uniref:Reverse transcriptase domain-containing protein n=1 Tax=Hibiscus trionum TaxID=183268 RepID=A0A9W7ICP1_HIBTR|nr:hypothetical protein HRI_002958900 [Hibiscus trionum]
MDSLIPWVSRRLLKNNLQELAFTPALGASGGLYTLWDPSHFKMETKIVEQRAIVLTGFLPQLKKKVGLINVYAPNESGERRDFFEHISNVIEGLNCPVLVGGDFNSVLKQEERSGMSYIQTATNSLADFVLANGLIDLPLDGGSFTWYKGGASMVASRLDRFLLSPELLQLFPQHIQSVLPRSLSDHCPVLLAVRLSEQKSRPFKWFAHWADDEQYCSLVRNICGSVGNQNISVTLRKVKEATKNWAREHRDSDSDSIASLEEKLARMEADVLSKQGSADLWKDIQALRIDLWKKYRTVEREWLQKSRLKYFQEGDRNTKFFHLTATLRSKTNFVSDIRVGNSVLKGTTQIMEAFVNHYKGSYSDINTIPVSSMDINLKKLSSTAAAKLEEPFSELEIWQAIKSVDGSRAPDPDGFNLDFFKKFWVDLKQGLMDCFLKFYNGEIFDESFNRSFITLIPKKSGPKSLDDFRPISLVGSIYKIVAKVLARRLAGCIEEVVGERQFTFISGKQIADCSLIANEIVDDQKRLKKEAVVFKADFKKAYDSVDWKFLDMILMKMGFGQRWRSWMFMCISTAKISILINGLPSKPFRIRKGLRQGCPLSPYLFNIIGEALSSLLVKAESVGLIKGVQVGMKDSRFSHIQFADDLIVFLEAKTEYIHNTKRILRIFELASGLKLNMKKSKLYGVNIREETVSDWAMAIRCGCDKFPTTYLGLPLGYPRNMAEIWKPIEGKVQARLQTWKINSLSFAGRITLVKSVLINLPMYYLSIFEMPAGVAARINRSISGFIWGQVDKCAIHWIKWETLCQPKSKGGLGLIDIRLKNRAMLNKWLWRFGTDSYGYWRKLLENKYDYQSQSLIPDIHTRRNFSWVWKAITAPLSNQEDLYTKNVRCVFGNGMAIEFWDDVWAGPAPLKVTFPRIFAVAQKKVGKVQEFGKEVDSVWTWNIDLRRSLFQWEISIWEEFLQVINKAIQTFIHCDTIRWVGSSSRHYSAREYCIAAQADGEFEHPSWKLIWANLAPPKVESFVWRAFQDRIPTRVGLLKRGIVAPSEAKCAFCEVELKAVNHVLLHCNLSWRIWARWSNMWQVDCCFPNSIEDLLIEWVQAPIKEKAKAVWCMGFFGILWSLWLCRNKKVFKSKTPNEDMLFDMVLLRVGYWCKGKWPSSIPSVSEFVRQPCLTEIQDISTVKSRNSNWVPPMEGEVKFNVDAAVKNNVGKAGLGGVLRDHADKHLVRFESPVGVSEPTSAEILAIRRAAELFIDLGPCGYRKLTIETDSALAAKWIENPTTTPISFRSIVHECNALCSSNGFNILFNYRETNCVAHNLAASAIHRSIEQIWICNELEAVKGMMDQSSRECRTVTVTVG